MERSSMAVVDVIAKVEVPVFVGIIKVYINIIIVAVSASEIEVDFEVVNRTLVEKILERFIRRMSIINIG